MTYHRLTVKLIAAFAAAVIIPGIILGIIATRALRSEETYLEKRLEDTLRVEVDQTVELIRNKISEIGRELSNNLKFTSGEKILEFWYTKGQEALEFGIPGVYMVEGTIYVDIPPQCWDYPDWWYVWVDINKLIESLEWFDKKLIHYYFSNIFSYKGVVSAFYRWRDHKKYQELADKIYMSVSEEFRWFKQFDELVLENRMHFMRKKLKKGDMSMDVDKDKMYTVEDVSVLFNYSQATIREILRRGVLKGIKLHEKGSWRIPGKTILEFYERLMNDEIL